MGAQGCPSRVHWRKNSLSRYSARERRAAVFSRITPHALIYFSLFKVGCVCLRVGHNSANQKVLRFLVAKWARDRKLDLLSSSSDVILALGPTTGTGNEKQRTLRKSKGAFLSEISRIMVDQMSRWILVQSGFIGSFDLPWSEWSEITGPDHGIRRRFRRRFQRFNQCRLTWHRRLMMPRTPSNFQRWLNGPIVSYNHILLWRLPKNQLSKYLLSG